MRLLLRGFMDNNSVEWQTPCQYNSEEDEIEPVDKNAVLVPSGTVDEFIRACFVAHARDSTASRLTGVVSLRGGLVLSCAHRTLVIMHMGVAPTHLWDSVSPSYLSSDSTSPRIPG